MLLYNGQPITSLWTVCTDIINYSGQCAGQSHESATKTVMFMVNVLIHDVTTRGMEKVAERMMWQEYLALHVMGR